ncbi:ROK family protein [Kitasatospora sp. NPDC059327]|uniref:ROK family transcriptional regulator n=1 Tax=Kitasatospora sp. NPDC059327 TaxID=3346803 RepID=UPI0036A87010
MNSPALTGGDPALLRRLNTEAVLRVLRNAGPMTLTNIGREASLSRQTVDVVITDLTEGGWIEEVAPGKGIGRPARRYRFRAEAGHVLGVDVGTGTLHQVITDLDGNVVTSRQASLGKRADDVTLLEAAEASARDLVGSRPDIRLRGLCLGVPGIVDTAGRITLSVPFPQWNGLDLAAAAGSWFDCPAHVENDANLATLAEHWLGAARGVDDFIEIIVGHRTGSGMMLGGRLHRGRGGAAGEIGALAVLGWESTAMNDIREADAPRIFADARSGDADAAGRVDRFARTLAQGAAAMVLTVNPDLVVIGGGLSLAGDALLEPLRGHLDQLCLDAPGLEISALGTEAVALGAARLALDRLNEELFGAIAAGAGSPGGTAPTWGRALNSGVFSSPKDPPR